MATFFFFFFFFVSGLKLDEKSIENGLEGQKFLVVCLFWGGCHHPNKARSYIYIYIFIYLFIFVPVWQKNNMSVTPVSQANCQNFCPISSLGFTKAYQWIKG